ncbi:MAG: FkbM family methyltransferase [Chitinophagaceae bacterium]
MLIKTDSTIIDIGANIGYYSVMAANISKNGHVYSFEPSPQIYGQLLLNIEANHLLNVKTFRCAVGRREGNLPFYLSGPDNTGMSGLRAAENYSGQTVITEVIVLDRWAADNKMKKIDFIKMDIEGAELEALSGMTIILEQQQPVLFIEIRLPLLQQFDQTPDAIYQLLYGFGYSAFEIGEKLTVRKINSFPEGDSILFIPKHFHFPDEITIVE